MCVCGSIRPKYFTALVWGKEKKKTSHKQTLCFHFISCIPPHPRPLSFMFVCDCRRRQNNLVAEMDKNCPLSPKATAATCSPPGECERKSRGGGEKKNNVSGQQCDSGVFPPPLLLPFTPLTPQSITPSGAAPPTSAELHTHLILFSIPSWGGFRLL